VAQWLVEKGLDVNADVVRSAAKLPSLSLKIAVEISRRAAERLRAQRMSGILRI